MEHRYEQFIREKQHLCNVSPSTIEGYKWAWKAFEPALTGRSCVTKHEILQRVQSYSRWSGDMRSGRFRFSASRPFDPAN